MSFKSLSFFTVVIVGGLSLAYIGLVPVMSELAPKWGPKCDEILEKNVGIAYGPTLSKDGKTGFKSFSPEEWRELALQEAGCDIDYLPQGKKNTATSNSDGASWEELEKQALDDEMGAFEAEYAAGGWGE